MAVPYPDQKKKPNVVPYPNTGVSNTSTNVPSPVKTIPAPPTGMSTISTRVPTPQTTAATATQTTPTIPRSNVPTPPNYRQELDNILNQYRVMANTPFSYNPQTDPQYQSYLKLAQGRADQAAKTASKNTLETMNERGILNSSVTSNQLGQIENQARQNAELEALSAVPQFQQQAYSQYQNRLNTLGNLVNTYAGLDDTQFNRGVTEAGLTGQYIPSQAQPIVNQLLALKQEAERPGLGAEVYAQYKAQGDALRNQLRAMGVDPSFAESNVTSGQAMQNMPTTFATVDQRNRMADQQLAQQEMEYQAARDAIADERWKQEFDRDTERWGLEYALQRQIQEGNLNVSRMNANTSRMNAETNRLDADRRFNQYEESMNQTKPLGASDYKTSPQFATDYQFILSNPEEAKRTIQDNADAFIQAYGYDGYRALISALPEEQQQGIFIPNIGG